MNCAVRLVEIFGSQAGSPRVPARPRGRQQLGESGYVPARWAMEVEQVTDGKIAALEVLNEAQVKKPVKVNRVPTIICSGRHSLERKPWTISLPPKRISSFHPPQRTLMGPGPTEIHPRVLTTMSQRRSAISIRCSSR